MSEMAVADADVSDFPQSLSIDTCAVWNVLSSRTLSTATFGQRRVFIVADYVRYECLAKPRAAVNSHQKRMISELTAHISAGRNFFPTSIAVEDLREISRLESIRRLGRGELAAVIVARRLRQGFMTDDRGARRLAREAMPEVPVRTTPHLVGWLTFVRAINDIEAEEVFREHDEATGRSSISRYMKACYHQGLRMAVMRAL